MRLRLGYRLTYEFPQPTPMFMCLNVHPSRRADLVERDDLRVSPRTQVTRFDDMFGNLCNRIHAPAGRIVLAADALIEDSGAPDPDVRAAPQHAVEDLPSETLGFLLGSRYCEVDLLTPTAWSLFADTAPGGARVGAICDFVHRHIEFGYEHASASKTALQALRERRGVCRDYAHLAVALCRALNIPARYCSGYLADIGVHRPVMDFAGWFEAYLGGEWRTFDPRNNRPCIGRVLIARGRDAADAAIATTFGPNALTGFEVTCEEAA